MLLDKDSLGQNVHIATLYAIVEESFLIVIDIACLTVSNVDPTLDCRLLGMLLTSVDTNTDSINERRSPSQVTIVGPSGILVWF